MPFFLRKVRKAKWLYDETLRWLDKTELQADALSDLKTDNNDLSVWHIEDDKSNLEQVVVAIAASRDNLANVDYLLVDQSVLSKANLKVNNTAGKTPYTEATKWHRDIVELTAQKLLDVGFLMYANHNELARMPEKKVLALITKRVQSGEIEPTTLKEEVRVRIATQ